MSRISSSSKPPAPSQLSSATFREETHGFSSLSSKVKSNFLTVIKLRTSVDFILEKKSCYGQTTEK